MMLYLYDKCNKSLLRCKETEFKNYGPLYYDELAKWIELNPSILGEELTIVRTVYNRHVETRERFDILGIDRKGNLVAIELKRDGSGKPVDLQVIEYAAYCSTLTFSDIVTMYITYQQDEKGITISPEEAQKTILDFVDENFEEFNDRPRIILVAKEFTSEVTAAVLWLRKFTIDITCVKWEPYELPDGQVAVNLSVLIPPREAKYHIGQVERKETANQRKNIFSGIEYIRFIDQCTEALARKLSIRSKR